MDFNQLRYFLSIDNFGSMSKAAKQLGVSQQSLSGSMKSLEKELGVGYLFSRTNKGVTLTPAGKEFKRFALGSMLAYKEMLVALGKSQTGCQKTRLAVGATDIMSADFLPPFIVEFLSRFPNIDLKVYNLPESEIASRVVQGDLDAGLVFRSMDSGCIMPTVQGPLSFDVVAPCAVYFWMSTLCPLSSHRGVTFSQISDYPVAPRELFDSEFTRSLMGESSSALLDVPLATEPRMIVESVSHNLAICPDVKIGSKGLTMAESFSRYPVVARPLGGEEVKHFDAILLTKEGSAESEALTIFRRSLLKYAGTYV